MPESERCHKSIKPILADKGIDVLNDAIHSLARVESVLVNQNCLTLKYPH